MKKRWRLIFLGIFSAVLIIIGICLTIFLSKTISPVEEYCIENTAINATSFSAYGHVENDGGNWVRYIFWVAEDGLSDRHELFILQQVQFGPIGGSIEWNRFRFSYRALSSGEEIVGSVLFTPRDTRDRKLSTNWMVFYSANQYHIARYTFTVEEDGAERILEGGTVGTEEAFVAVLTDLGEKDGVSRKFIKAEFFDARGNLVEVIGGN